MDFDASGLLDAVVHSFDDTPDLRTRQILQAVTRHLHALVTEIRPTRDEWERAVAFLTAVGQTCDATRQEFVLLSDVLGVSSLVETLNSAPGATPGTVLGPFHMTQSPPRALGDTLDEVGTGMPCVVRGTVADTEGHPIADASLDVWQGDDHGFYDVQQPGVQPEGNGRGLFRTDAQGRYWFRTVVPSPYPIPVDGPVGALLGAARRHPYRPAHIHFVVEAPGHVPVTTHAFVADGPYVDDDAVFAVKGALIVDFAEVNDAEAAGAYDVRTPFRLAQFDIRLGNLPVST